MYLDISFATDPEVVFPLIITPSSLAAFHSNEAWGPYPAGAFGGPSYSDFPPPAFPVEPYPVHMGPGAYGYQAPGTYPQIGANNNQWPQQADPNGFSFAAPAPPAPPQFQQGEEPPSYTSLFPDSHENLSSIKSHSKS